jgi:hypothetical protein
MLIDLIETSFCEMAIEEERSDVSERIDNKSGIATCYRQYFVTELIYKLQSIKIII